MILNRVHFRASRVVSVQDSAQAQHEALTEQLREFLETGHEINNVDVLVSRKRKIQIYMSKLSNGRASL